MANSLEDEVLDSFNIGEEVVLESIDTNPALDSRIVDKSRVGKRINNDSRYKPIDMPEKIFNKLKVEERIDSNKTHRFKKTSRTNRSYRRNDLPRTYLLADALLREVKDYLSQKETADSVVGYSSVSESLQAEEWNPYTNSEINGKILSERDSEDLRELFKNDFLPLKYGGNVYFVSERLLDNEVSDNFIKTHGLDEVIRKLGNHLGLEIVMPKEKLPDSQAEIIVVYGKMPEPLVFPGGEREHTSLLMGNTCESAGNGYGSRVPDDLIKGGDEFLESLPSPGQVLFEMHGRSKGIRRFHIDNPVANEIAKSQKKQSL